MKENGAVDMKRYLWEKMAHGKIPILNRMEKVLEFVKFSTDEKEERAERQER